MTRVLTPEREKQIRLKLQEYIDNADDLEELLAEIDRLRSEIKELKHAAQCAYGDSPSMSYLQHW